MADIKLFYFDFRGRAELCRLVLALGGRTFQDVRFTRDEWPKYKAESPFGQAPYIEYNGKKYGQSVAIANFFARELGLYGKSNLDAFRIDEVMGLAQDTFLLFNKAFAEQDEAKKAEELKKVTEETLPRQLSCFQKLLKENRNGVFVGNDLTLADLCVYDMLVGLHTLLKYDFGANFPELKRLQDKVEANPRMKEYNSERKGAKF